MLPKDDILFDRLADGELSPAERRELLASLDGRRMAGGGVRWRFSRRRLGAGRCRHWSLKRPVRRCEHAVEEVPLEPEWTMNWYAIAASLLFAFTMGLAFRDLPHSHQTRTPSPSNIATIRPQQRVFAPQLLLQPRRRAIA